jgi:hypothetical protein
MALPTGVNIFNNESKMPASGSPVLGLIGKSMPRERASA